MPDRDDGIDDSRAGRHGTTKRLPLGAAKVWWHRESNPLAHTS
jgi:hypothetical protein